MKKAATMVLAIVFSLIIISGCAQQQNTGSGQAQNTPNDSTPGTVNQIRTNTNGGTVNQVPTNVGNPNPGQPSTGSANAQVNIENFAFSPGNITVKAGDTVTWANKDNAPHTVTSDSGSELQSSTLNNGGTYKHLFSEPGTFGYKCSIHPGMKGTITVQ